MDRHVVEGNVGRILTLVDPGHLAETPARVDDVIERMQLAGLDGCLHDEIRRPQPSDDDEAVVAKLIDLRRAQDRGNLVRREILRVPPIVLTKVGIGIWVDIAHHGFIPIADGLPNAGREQAPSGPDTADGDNGLGLDTFQYLKE